MFLQQNHTLCDLMNRMELKLITFGHATVEPDWQGPAVDTTCSRLYFVLRGSFFLHTEDGRILTLSEGGCYLVPSGAQFTYGCHETMEHIFFHLKLCGSDGIDLLNCHRTDVFPLEGAGDGTRFSPLIQNYNPLDGIRLKQELYRLVVSFVERYHILEEEHRYSSCVSRAIEIINAQKSVALTVEEIAKYACVSRSTLTKHFKKEVGRTITEYLYDVVMTEACRLLRGTEKTILEISEEFGFCDAFYFSRQFSRRFGIPPREYHRIEIL